MPIPRKLAPGIVMLPNLAKKRRQNCKTGSRNKRESERPRIDLSGKRSMRALPISPATFLRYVTILLIPTTSAVETPAQNFVGKSSAGRVEEVGILLLRGDAGDPKGLRLEALDNLVFIARRNGAGNAYQHGKE